MGPIEKKARKLTNRSVLCGRQALRLGFVRTPCFGCTNKYLLMSRQGCTQFYWLLAENNSFGMFFLDDSSGQFIIYRPQITRYS